MLPNPANKDAEQSHMSMRFRQTCALLGLGSEGAVHDRDCARSRNPLPEYVPASEAALVSRRTVLAEDLAVHNTQKRGCAAAVGAWVGRVGVVRSAAAGDGV